MIVRNKQTQKQVGSHCVPFCARTTWSILLLFLFTTVSAFAQESKQSAGNSSSPRKDQKIIDRTFAFRAFQPMSSPAIDLGSLEAGEMATLNLELQNNSSANFEIKDILPSCSCYDVRSNGKQIPSGGSVQLSVSINVPKTARGKSFQQSISVVGVEEGTALQILFSYKPKGVCCFAETLISKTVPPGIGKAQISIPVNVTEPTKVKDIKVAGTGDFINVPGKFVETKEGLTYQFEVSLPEGDGFVLTGGLTIENEATGTSDSAQCIVSREAKISIFPKTVRFVKEGESWRSSVIVKVNKDWMKANDTKMDLSIGAGWSKIPLSTEVTQLSSGIARVHFSVLEKDLFENGSLRPESKEAIQWQVGWEGGIAEVNSNVVVQ